jgi:hypothetical protein
MRDVALVAGERLVSPVTHECDGDVPPRLFGDQEGRERGLVAERLVEGCCKARERRGDVFFDLHLLVQRPVTRRDRTRICTLVIAHVRKPDREGAHRL